MQQLLALAIRLVRWAFTWFWLLCALLLLLSWAGWLQYLATHPFNGKPAGHHTIWDAVMLTLMLAPMKSPLVTGPDVPFLLNLGRLLLPFMFLGGLFKVTLLRSATEQQVNRWFVKTFRDHTVVCGLSAPSLALIGELLRREHWVVLVDPKPDALLLDKLHQVVQTMPRLLQTRLAILQLDFTSSNLRSAGVGRAAAVYAMTEENPVNLQIAASATSVMPTDPSHMKSGPPRLHVHLKNETPLSQADHHLGAFNLRAMAARQLVNTYPADAPWLASRDFTKPPHAIVIGLGVLGEEVVVQLARGAHYANAQRMQVTAVDINAAQAASGLLGRYPMLAPSVAPGDFGMPTTESSQAGLPTVALTLISASADEFVNRHLTSACLARGLPGAIYVCLGDDLESDRASRALEIGFARARREISQAQTASFARCTLAKVRRRMSEAATMSPTEATNHTAGEWLDVVEIDILRAAAAAQVGGGLEQLAQRAHEDYRAYSEFHDLKTADRRRWNELDPEARQMNANTTEHHFVRLREMGLTVNLSQVRDGKLEIDADQAREAMAYFRRNSEKFAAAEHRRWLFDKLSFGWRFADGGQTDKTARLNAFLVDYEELTDEIKQYDRDNAARALLLLPAQLAD